MPLEFDPTKSFDENLASFLRYLEAANPSMAALLKSQLDALKTANSDEKRRTVRTAFNAAIKAKIDEPPPAAP